MNDYKQSLITYLLKYHTYVVGSQLAKALGVSTKTVQRAVKSINSAASGHLIESRRGRGYRLNYQYYLRQNQHKKFTDKVTSVQRRNEVLQKLLSTSPEKHYLNNIFSNYYISDSVVSTDLHYLRQMLKKYNLVLHRHASKIWITGQEINIRNAMNDLLVKDDVTSIDYFLQKNQYIRKRDASFVVRQLNLIEKQMNSEIPYPYNINLFSHLYILIKRYANVGRIIDSDLKMTLEEQQKMQKQPRLSKICHTVVQNLNDYLHSELPTIEEYYLFQYLTSSRTNNERIGFPDSSNEVWEITNYLISQVMQDPRYRTIKNSELANNLAKHMKPLLNRLQNHIRVNNDLLDQINLEYPHLYKIVKAATAKLVRKFKLPQIDDNEIGFITIYFAQAAESTQPPIDIMIVCTTGLGTAQLLKLKIAKRFSELNIVEVLASRNVKQELNKFPNVQLIVSTVNLPSLSVPVLVTTAMLTTKDEERLDRAINKIRRERTGE